MNLTTAARTMIEATKGHDLNSITITSINPDIQEVEDGFGNEIGAKEGLSIIYTLNDSSKTHYYFHAGTENDLIEEAEEMD